MRNPLATFISPGLLSILNSSIFQIENFTMQKLALILLLIIGYATSAQQLSLSISVTAANQYARPVRVQLSKPILTKGSFSLYNQTTRKTVPAQLLDSVTLVFMTEENLGIGNYIYVLIKSKKKEGQSPVSVINKENGLLVKVKDKPVFFYHTKEATPPADSPAYYRRSGFIHPLYSPSGKILTDDFPADHAHQHGIFFAWTRTTFKNSLVDFWNQHAKKGTVEHIKVLDITNGPVASVIRTNLRHRSLEHGEVLAENWTITVYSISDYFLFDLESEQQNTTRDTLFLNKYIYGGLAFRGSRQWNIHDKNYKAPWSILTSEGDRDSSANHRHARWVDASGTIDGSTAGATVFNHPSNFRYPQSIRVHPQMPYWTYAPVVDDSFYIAPGAFYRSRFRYYVHEDNAQPTVIEQLFNDWADSSGVKVIYK
jgi:hypothetical protein